VKMFSRPAGLAILAVLALAGCSSTTSNIDIQDRSALIPTARIAIDFSERPGPPSHIHTSHAVELGVTGATGDDTLRVETAQQPLVFGGENFSAPQDIRAEFDFRFTELAYRYRYVSERRGLGFEALAGLAYSTLGLRLIGATRTSAERLEGTGIVVGLGTMFRLWPSGSIQFRGSGFASTTSEGVSSVGRYEVVFEQALGRHAAVRAGYAGIDVRSRREDDEFSSSNRSPIRVRINGPMLGLSLMF
jgi:hypothetical protein